MAYPQLYFPDKVSEVVGDERHKKTSLFKYITSWQINNVQYTQGHIVIDVRRVGFDMSDNRSDGDRCNKKGHKTRELSQQV